MTEVTRRLPGPQLPDFRDLIDPLGLLDLRPKLDFHPIRVEDAFEGDDYLLRAELPGIDPEKDVEIIVSEGTLTILAERTEDKQDRRHTEFRYGAFSRAVRLPQGAQEEKVHASYSNGILTVTVPIEPPAEAPVRKIAVQAR
jgi:HSP20 family protein